MNAARDADLAYLRRNWGGDDGAYVIAEALGVWRAIRADNQRVILGTSAEALHALIVADYTAQPVRREGR